MRSADWRTTETPLFKPSPGQSVDGGARLDDNDSAGGPSTVSHLGRKFEGEPCTGSLNGGCYLSYGVSMTWAELCNERRLEDLPYKIELDPFGKIVMSPTRNIHGYYASEIAQLLKGFMGRGKTLVECAVETADGTKVTDVACIIQNVWSY